MKKTYIFTNGKLLLKTDDGLIDEPKRVDDIPAFEKLKYFFHDRNDGARTQSFKPFFSKELGYVKSKRDHAEKCRALGLECWGDAPPPQYKEDDSDALKLSSDEIRDIKEKTGLSGSDASCLENL